MPAAAAVSAVTEPMQTTTGGAQAAPAESTKPLTVDEEVKQMASAAATSASAGSGTARVTVR